MTSAPPIARWYSDLMSGKYSMVVGNKGRVVLPAGLREERGWEEGTVLVVVRTERGVLIESQEALLATIQSGLAGTDLVGELLRERRAAARLEDTL